MVVKIPAAPGVNRASGETIQAYEREIVAYRDLGLDMGMPMPRLYYAELDENRAEWLRRPINFLFDKLPIRGVNWLIVKLIALSGKVDRRYVLVIEDIDNARPPTQVAGGSVADAEAALDVLARFPRAPLDEARHGRSTPGSVAGRPDTEGLAGQLSPQPRCVRRTVQLDRERGLHEAP